MDIGLLHTMCKQDTRKGFNEFKRVLEVELFPFSSSIKTELQNQLKQGLCAKTVKHFVMNYKLSDYQIGYMTKVIKHYEQIALTTSNNYARRFL
jgi:hypothetical protein